MYFNFNSGPNNGYDDNFGKRLIGCDFNLYDNIVSISWNMNHRSIFATLLRQSRWTKLYASGYSTVSKFHEKEEHMLHCSMSTSQRIFVYNAGHRLWRLFSACHGAIMLLYVYNQYTLYPQIIAQLYTC